MRKRKKEFKCDSIQKKSMANLLRYKSPKSEVGSLYPGLGFSPLKFPHFIVFFSYPLKKFFCIQIDIYTHTYIIPFH